MDQNPRELIIAFRMGEKRGAKISSFAARYQNQFKIVYRADSNADRPYLRSLQDDIPDAEIEQLQRELDLHLSNGGGGETKVM
jgi:hypothetical protein